MDGTPGIVGFDTAVQKLGQNGMECINVEMRMSHFEPGHHKGSEGESKAATDHQHPRKEVKICDVDVFARAIPLNVQFVRVVEDATRKEITQDSQS